VPDPNARCSCGSGKKSKNCCGTTTAPLNRTPPADIRRRLRNEVGFGCPVEGCGNPYLEYHHFDPRWSQTPHHDPNGMIALCSRHHPHADAGAWTKDQLREMKRHRSSDVGEKLQWMRTDVLTVVGGNFFYETPVAVQYRQQPVVWYRRDDQRRLLLNIRMLSLSSEPRLTVDDNDWVVRGTPLNLECPPSGKKISARYLNGDYISIEFTEIESSKDLFRRLPKLGPPPENIDDHPFTFPLAICEITMSVAGTSLRFGPKGVAFPGGGGMSGVMMRGRPVGLQLE